MCLMKIITFNLDTNQMWISFEKNKHIFKKQKNGQSIVSEATTKKWWWWQVIHKTQFCILYNENMQSAWQ